ncbi:hypothetical protein, partial [Roseibium sp.]
TVLPNPYQFRERAVLLDFTALEYILYFVEPSSAQTFSKVGYVSTKRATSSLCIDLLQDSRRERRFCLNAIFSS